MTKNPTKDDMYRLYIEEDKSIEEISEITEMNYLKVIQLIKEYQIKLRKKYIFQVISKEVLTYLYIELNMTQKELKELIGCTVVSIENLIKRYEIVKKIPLKDLVTYDEMYNLYYIQDLSTVKIGEIYNVRHGTVRRTLEYYNIPKKKILEEIICKEKMIELYEKQKKSTLEIAKMYKYSPIQVVRLANKYGIEMRSMNPFLQLGLDFEYILKEIFEALSYNYKYQHYIGEVIPDFYNLDKNIIIEAKLNSSDLYNVQFNKYIEISNKVIVVYLAGERNTNTDDLLWRHVSYYYPQLKKIGREDLIEKLHELVIEYDKLKV